MRVRHLGGLLGCVVTACLLAGVPAARAVTVGVALPQGALASSPESAEPVRQSLMAQLQAQSVTAVPLTSAGFGGPVDAEAQAKHCDYVLYTRLEKKQGGGGMFSKLGSLSKLAPMAASALPLGALGGHGGGSMVGAAMQQAASSAMSASAQQQMMSSQQQLATQIAGTALSGVKQGDTVTLDYRLMRVGSSTALRSDSLSGKASGDGQDVVSPLVTQAATAVSSAAQGTAAAGAATPATPTTQSEPAPATQRGSLLGGLLGRHHGAAPPAGSAGNIDCSKIASMSNSPNSVPVSLEDCQKFQSAQQAYTQGAASAARPGDEQLTCEQITAELHQQQFTAPDKDKVVAADATVTQVRADLKHSQEVAAKLEAEDTATMAAASAADTATELTTGGLVRGRAMQAAQKVVDERNAAANAQLAKEQRPTQQKMISQTSDFSSGFGSQLQSNPRLARLVQLADSKHCHGG